VYALTASRPNVTVNQVVARCLDHGFDRGGGQPVVVGSGLGAEDGAHRGHVQAGAGAVDHPVEQLLHLRADPKE
jgi:hypothetical protein